MNKFDTAIPAYVVEDPLPLAIRLNTRDEVLEAVYQILLDRTAECMPEGTANAAEWFVGFMCEPRGEHELARKISRAVAVSPYRGRVLYLLDRFLAESPEYRKAIIEYRKAGIDWRGESLEFMAVLATWRLATMNL